MTMTMTMTMTMMMMLATAAAATATAMTSRAICKQSPADYYTGKDEKTRKDSN